MPLIKKNILSFFYFLIGIPYAYYRVFPDNQKLLIFKSAILLLLILNYFILVKRVNVFFTAVLILELVGGILFSLNTENFILGLTFFLLTNLLLTVIITKNIGVIKEKDIRIILLIVSIIILATTYFTFQNIGYIKALLIIFAIVFSILLSLSYANYKKSATKFAILFLTGILLFTFRYMIGGYVRLVESNKVLILIESISYVIGLFLLSKAMIVHSKENTLSIH